GAAVRARGQDDAAVPAEAFHRLLEPGSTFADGLERLADRSPRGDAPEPGRFRSPREQGPAVRAEGRRPAFCVVLREDLAAQELAGGCLPPPDGLVLAPRQNGFPVGAETDGGDMAGMSEGGADRLAGRRVPEPGGVLEQRRDEYLAVGAEGRTDGRKR